MADNNDDFMNGWRWGAVALAIVAVLLAVIGFTTDKEPYAQLEKAAAVVGGAAVLLFIFGKYFAALFSFRGGTTGPGENRNW